MRLIYTVWGRTSLELQMVYFWLQASSTGLSLGFNRKSADFVKFYERFNKVNTLALTRHLPAKKFGSQLKLGLFLARAIQLFWCKCPRLLKAWSFLHSWKLPCMRREDVSACGVILSKEVLSMTPWAFYFSWKRDTLWCSRVSLSRKFYLTFHLDDGFLLKSSVKYSSASVILAWNFVLV